MTDLDLSQRGGSRAARRALWRGHVLARAGSGLSAAAYCREHGLDVKAFYRWKQALGAAGELPGDGVAQGGCRRERAAVSSGVEALFAEVRLAGGAAGEPAGVEVCLRAGHVVRVAAGFDAATLRRVVAVLEGQAC